MARRKRNRPRSSLPKALRRMIMSEDNPDKRVIEKVHMITRDKGGSIQILTPDGWANITR